jgi:hypothetical protein
VFTIAPVLGVAVNIVLPLSSLHASVFGLAVTFGYFSRALLYHNRPLDHNHGLYA